MKSELLLITVVGVTASLLTREFFPRRVVDKVQIPVIVPKYDTVKTLPDWFEDSLKIWKRRKHTTDTIPILVERTIVDTQWFPVNNPPEDRPNLWPVLQYRGSDHFGDTAVVSSYSVRTGQLALSKVYIPGVLVAMEADTVGTPKLTYNPFPVCPGPSFLYRLKLIGAGTGAGYVLGRIF